MGELKGYHLVGCERLSQAVSEIGVCSACSSPLTCKGGFGYYERIGIKAKICCTNTACNKEGVISDPYASDTKSLNARSVLGLQELGRGQPAWSSSVT